MGNAVIHFGKACLIDVLAYLVAMQLLFTSGPYFNAVLATEATAAITWALVAAYRVRTMMFRRDKVSLQTRDNAALGFWVGVLTSIVGLVIYTAFGLNHIDV